LCGYLPDICRRSSSGQVLLEVSGKAQVGSFTVKPAVRFRPFTRTFEILS
jgi:hypothetical protein